MGILRNIVANGELELPFGDVDRNHWLGLPLVGVDRNYRHESSKEDPRRCACQGLEGRQMPQRPTPGSVKSQNDQRGLKCDAIEMAHP